jgi:hypothetical protein
MRCAAPRLSIRTSRTSTSWCRTGRARAALEILVRHGLLVWVGHGENVTLDVSRNLIGPELAVRSTCTWAAGPERSL